MFSSFKLSGIGLHSGAKTTVKVSPAEKGKGRYFVRVDLPDKPIIPASIDCIATTTLSTELSNGEAKIRTVEHLLASLFACGVEDAEIAIDGYEVPLLDGSAQIWVNHIDNKSENPFRDITETITEEIWVRKGDAFCAVLPSPEIKFSYGVDYPYPVLQNQWYSWYPEREHFVTAIAPARTFGFADQIKQLQTAGLIKGGTLENALVCDDKGWLNPPLRFENEAVRHKLLDLIGDLSLLGKIPRAHYLAYKASHQLHTELAKKIKLSQIRI
ncbi:UDP-3-O-acyl-N-acetylglucosamine deacetylase [Geminocystis sp. NIES-3709]|uniref:UDP-3-O-acyl-N-acetylglucosamine deacetylase n=1 Tax=Geminocystis sp. NIES-3709 TaxID=1617448 RepID=UPI0005FC6BFE|nr:UDP-3-O-acyl-N-acetylglucosamine deacetylase [Geminocystis sp. NIES-3709]BAQ63877.1 UDP-3-O-[3-hydroxymyristoyl] N-acetylglucosamine deacetylase [Geminocystis sp. NIES-3709]